MKQYRVAFSPEAEEQLAELYRYIAKAAPPATAERYTSMIVEYCADLKNFPARGTPLDEIRPGLRITNFKANAMFAFAVDVASLRCRLSASFTEDATMRGFLSSKAATSG